MFKNIIKKLEKTQEFAAKCAENGDFSLIDKDIILQNLREIYLETSNLSIFEQDSFDEDFNNNNSFVFDDSTSHNIYNQQPDAYLTPDIVESECDNVVTFASEPEYLYTLLSDEDAEAVMNELCDGDRQLFNVLSRKLQKINDLDSAILYLHDNYPDKLNCSSVSILAEALSQKIF